MNSSSASAAGTGFKRAWVRRLSAASLGILTGFLLAAFHLSKRNEARGAPSGVASSVSASAALPSQENPASGGGRRTASEAENRLDPERLLALALADPEKYLASTGDFVDALSERGFGSLDDICSYLLPSLQAAFKTLHDRDPDKAFAALDLIKYSSGETIEQARRHLMHLGMASRPAETAALMKTHFGPFYLAEQMAVLWFQADPVKAAEWVAAEETPWALRGLVREWTKHDPAAALRWSMSLGDEKQRMTAQAQIIKELDGKGASLLPVANELLKSWETPRAAEIMKEALIKWQREDPETLAQWMAGQEQSPHAERLIESMAVARLMRDPSKSAEILATLPSQALRETAVTEMTARLLDSAEHVRTWRQVTALEDPEFRAKAFATVLAHAADLQTPAALPAAVKSLQTDPEVTLNAIRQTARDRPGALNSLWSDAAVEKALAKTAPEQAALFREALAPKAERPE